MRLRVLAVAVVTDQCLPDALEEANVEKIIATAVAAGPRLTRLVAGVLAGLAGKDGAVEAVGDAHRPAVSSA